MSTKRKTRASESAVETPESKRRKASELESAEKTQSLGYELLDKLKSARDKRNRLISIEFAELPDKEEVPDYYDVIKLPVAFDTVEDKLNQLQYPTLTVLESDLQRLVVNAQTYNEKDSEIYANAEKVKRHVDSFMKQHNPAYNDPDYKATPTPISEEEVAISVAKSRESGRKTRGKESITLGETIEDDASDAVGSRASKGKRRLTLNGPRSTSAAEPNEPLDSPKSNTSGTGFEGKTFQEAQEILLDDLLDFTNDEGIEISGPFANLPPRDLRDYYQVIKKPVSLRSIQKKVRGQKGREKASGQSLFPSWQELEEELDLIWNNARQYNEEGSEIYGAAGELEAHFQTRLKQAKALVQEPAQPKVTLRVGTRETEPSMKLKLHLSSKSNPTDSHSIDSETLNPQQDTVTVATDNEVRAASRTTDEAISIEAKPAASPDVQTNGVKDEIAVSQSPPAPSGVRRASSALGDKAPSVGNTSIPPTSGAAPATDGSPAPSQPRVPPPPPPRDPLEARLRPVGKGAADALINKFVLSTHPSRKEEPPFRMSIPPSEKLSQQSVTVTLPATQRSLRVTTGFPTQLFQRPHRIIMRLNREHLQPAQARSEEFDPRLRTFDANLTAGSVNVLDLEVLVSSTPRGAPKVGTGSEYDYERMTVYLNICG